ncbi:probable ATP-dependent RNA helicase CG8611 isoform X2 [Toxorhynchites rutilus septentrionalis]|uniref:probable ATP-dependent RNA helicase CG8611 isoform X2 n=1 Tax=Toxorhynchites rutilus septentrionalis TaxID=329112 RepID=UPI00247908DE|nr:probable ATP-dependent RNA helicase CG8611 isoform X2 [Toxorhynchites rutilus septentrionalis]
MDLMLSNFITDSEPIVQKKNKSFGGTDGGGQFSMVFNKSQPVKAIVARKRVAPAAEKLSAEKGDQKSKAPFTLKPPEKSKKSEPAEERGDGPNGSNANRKSSLALQSPEAVRRVHPVKESKSVSRDSNEQRKTSFSEKFKKDRNEGGNNETQSQFSLSEKFKQIKKHNKSNMFDRMKTAMPKVDLPEVHPLTEKVFSDSTLDSLDIHPHSKKNVVDLLGYEKLTVVQSLSIPKLLEGRDALVRAQTGSGKTLAYALPLVEMLHSRERKIARSDGILAAIVVPTRELALQTYELFVKLLKPFTWIVSGYLCGGEKRKAEKARLRAGLNILIATPGRFCDHIKNTESMKLDSVRYLILDEADRLLELGYEKDVKEIVESIKATRRDRAEQESGVQTVLLSATLTNSVKELAGLTLKEPAYIDTSDIAVERRFDNVNLEDMKERITIPATVRQNYIVIPPKLRLVTLSGVIAYEFNRKANKALVFMATQDLVDYHYNVMVEVLTQKKLDSDNENSSDEDEENDESESETEASSDGSILLPNVSFFKLHGKMTQIERSSVFREFRESKSAVLLCTDVVARGIDVPCVDLVVQYHAPQILADYVHRIGRTARAGQRGKAVLFVEPAEVDFVKYLTGKQIRLFEEKVDPIFNRVGLMLNSTEARKNKNKEQAAIELQHRFEKLVLAEKELFSGACKAFVSWVRYYSNFPKELRRIFSIKAVNMGHYAKCLGLRDPPKQFVRQYTGPREHEHSANRGGPNKGDHSQMNARKRPRSVASTFHKAPSSTAATAGARGGNKRRDLASYAQNSRMLNTSEFESGLGPARKKARQR